MAAEGALSFSVASVVEDVLQQHGSRSRDLDLDSRRAEEAAIRRYEAAAWLRKIVGVVGARDLPAEPSEEEFRLGLRSGLILCNVLNKIQPGAVSKVVESPCDSTLIPDGAALSAYQYFENIRNFLVSVQEMGLPTFEASDLEQGGKSARIVNCVLGLKSYNDWKQIGGNGVWKFGGTLKLTAPLKHHMRKNSEPFTSSLSRNMSLNEKSLSALCPDSESSKMPSSPLSMLVRTVLLDKKAEEVPTLVESVLTKVMEEFEHRLASQVELKKASSKDLVVSHGNKIHLRRNSGDTKIEERNVTLAKKEQCFSNNYISDKELKRSLKHQMIFDRQQKDIMELKQTLSTTRAGIQFMQMKFHEEMQNLGLHIHGLTHAASGYHKVLVENRKLYNQVQDLKGNIRVYCRVRPFLGGQSKCVTTVDQIEEGIITISTPSRHGKGNRSFNFNRVFGPSATQGEVFSDTQPLIRSVLDGYNVCIFAYGQTGSGKTYTMTGPKDLSNDTLGVNYRALGDLFLLAEQRRDAFQYDVSVQMIEIYNEQVRDLLVTDGLNKRLEIRNSSQTGLNVPDASLVHVTSTSDVIDLMNLGQRNRAVGATALNDRSSRSHSCLTVHVQGRDLTSGAILRGCMHLVDLAGSERVDKSEVTGDRLKEAQHINKSLSALGDVISSLAQKNSHVPYRNSKLTQLLQDSLGGQAKTLMFVHISPEPDAVGETISTLKFAERVATVELGAARVNKDSSDVKELKEQIASLKAALAKKEREPEPMQRMLSESPCGMSSPFQSNIQSGDMSIDPNNRRKPMGDVGNIEVRNNSSMRQKRQSFDLDELLGNSPPWPPVSSPGQQYGEEDRDMGSGDWVDKVMVNKQDATRRVENPLGCWEAENGNMSDVFYQKYLSDSSKIYPEQSYNMFPAANQFDIATNDDLDEVDAATSDSSEPDLLWQYNQSKLSNLANGFESKTRKPNPMLQGKSPELSKNAIPKLRSSPLQKMGNAHRNPPHPKLLDAACAKDENYEPGDDPRKLRPGEIDPNPESKPARPDPVDMDEDEKEMLSEARARLANTRGKKAKRKAREKQLEEARRLASLQKRRELKAAGIDNRQRKRKRKGIDYNTEIPFEKKPPPGFYDVTDENQTVEQPKFPTTIEELEGEKRADKEARLRKQDAARNKIAQRQDAPSAILQANKLNDPEAVRKRPKMNLPTPQIPDHELEHIAKFRLPDSSEELAEGNGATRALLADYSQTPRQGMTPLRTPRRTPAGKHDAIMMEAENQARLRLSQTPLLGGENPELHPSDFSGVTPKKKEIQTPNRMLTPSSTPSPGGVGLTPRIGMTPLRDDHSFGMTPKGTPIRDELHINEDMDMHDSAKLELRRQADLRRNLRSGLTSLPQPKNEYQIVVQPVPEDNEEPEEKIEEDMSDRIARDKAEEEARLQALLKKRSKVLQRELPRPPTASLELLKSSLIKADEGKSSFVPPTLIEQADEMVRKELLSLLEHDNLRYPTDEKVEEKKKGKRRATKGKSDSAPMIDEFEEDELKEADHFIKEESQYLCMAMGHKNESLDEFVEAHSTCLNDIMYFPTRSAYGLSSVAGNMEKLAALQDEFENVKRRMEDDTKKAIRLEQKIKLLTNGYQMRATKLWSQIEATFKPMGTAGTELECFQALRKQEQLAAAHRINTLWEEVQKQKELEQTLQKRYGYHLSEQERIHHLMNESREQTRILEENEAKQRALELAEAEEKQRALELAEAEEKQRALEMAEAEEKQRALEMAEAEEKQRAHELAKPEIEGDARQNALQLAEARAAENQIIELAEGAKVQEEILGNQDVLPLVKTQFADKLQEGITADQNALELDEVDVSLHQAVELAESEGAEKIQDEIVGNQLAETEVAANQIIELPEANATVNLQEEDSVKQT